MLTYRAPALIYKKQLIDYRREVLRLDGDFDGSAGLGNFSTTEAWLEHLHCLDAERASLYGYYPTVVHLAFEEDGLVGICNVRLSDDPLICTGAGHIGYHVRPSMRSRGYGTAILLHALALCREHGIPSPVVCTLPYNLASQRTALRAGFVRKEDVILENGQRVARFVYINQNHQ